jgi:hypothetical protein
VDLHGDGATALLAGFQDDPLPSLLNLWAYIFFFTVMTDCWDQSMHAQFRGLLNHQVHLFSLEETKGHREGRALLRFMVRRKHVKEDLVSLELTDLSLNNTALPVKEFCLCSKGHSEYSLDVMGFWACEKNLLRVCLQAGLIKKTSHGEKKEKRARDTNWPSKVP